MRRVRFAFVGEGPSDRGLVRHLETLCVRAGADEALGEAPPLERLPDPPGHAVVDQVKTALRVLGRVDLLFIHRDADARDPTRRREELAAALADLSHIPPHVLVVPVQETEAWLLTDPDAIRAAVGTPDRARDLDLPPLHAIERTARPKELLRAALLRASATTGRRRERLEGEFPFYRSLLLERLDIDGPVRRLASFRRLVQDIETALAAPATAPSIQGRRRR